MNTLYYYGEFSLIWYLSLILTFIAVYGFITMKSSFRKLASLMLLFSSALPPLLVCGMFTEDLKTTQAMAVAIIAIQVAIAAIGLTVVRKTIPNKLFKTNNRK